MPLRMPFLASIRSLASFDALQDRLTYMERMRPLARAGLRVLQGYRRFTEVGRRSMQRFTPVGKTLLWLYMASLFFVVDTRATMNFQLFALLLAALCCGFVAALLMGVKPGVISARRILPRFATAGAPLEYDIVLRNTSNRLQRSLRVVESLLPEHALETAADKTARRRLVLRDKDVAALRVRLAWKRLLQGRGASLQVREAAAPTIPPGGEVRVRITALPHTRGVLRFSESALITPDPLGLFRSFSPLPAGESLVVLPARYSVPRLSLGAGRKHQPGGLPMATRIGEEGEFASVREYRHGDPLRHIHWRSFARHGKPIVKQYQQEYFARHGLVLDTFPDPTRVPTRADALCFEAAVSMAASFSAAPQDQDTLLDLLFVGDTAHCVTAGRGLGSVSRMLEILAGVEPNLGGDKQQAPDFHTLSALVQTHAPVLSGSVCIFLGYDQERRNLVEALRLQGVAPWVLLLPCGRETVADVDDPQVHVLDPENLEQGLAAL